MAGLFEGNQFLFLVLIALVISGALRVALELRTANSAVSQPVNTASSCRDALKSLAATSASAGSIGASKVAAEEDPKSPFYGLKPWALPVTLGQGLFPPTASTIDPSQFKFIVKMLAFDRADSILRSLNSLEAADYGTDTVALDIFVDHTFAGADPSKWNPSAARRVAQSQALLLRLDGFHWSHGEKRVIYRTSNVGIQGQWMESWWPASLNEFVLVVEDDMEVSPLYYQYFKRLLAHYYYNASNFEPHMYGISFQRQTFVAGIGGSPVHPAPHPYLYQLVGTWGQFLFPLPWRAFRIWYDQRRHNLSRVPVLEGLKTTQWWYNKGNRLWTPWIIKWAYSESMFTLYPSFPTNVSLSISHRDKGSNFGKNRGADSSLVSSLPSDPKDPITKWWHQDFPPLSLTPRRDLCFHVVPHYPPARQLDELNLLLEAMRLELKRVALIIIPPGGYDFVRNWLCHVEGLQLRNFVLVVSSSQQATTLSNMGHMVYHTNKFSADEETSWSGVGVALSGGVTTGGRNQWTSEHVQLVLATLSFGFDTLVSSPDMVWVGNPLATDFGESFDMWGHLDPINFSDSFLYVHSSENTIAAWSRLRAAWANAESEGKSPVLLQQAAQGWLMGRDITFETVEGIPLDKVQEAKGSASLQLVMAPRTLSREGQISALRSAGLWTIDDFDLSCKSIACRKKTV